MFPAPILPRRMPLDRDSEFALLIEPLLNPAYRFAMHLSHNAEDAEDLIQEAALLALQNFQKFQPGTNFKAWLFRIILNRFCSRRRRDSRVVELDDVVEQKFVDQRRSDGFYTRSSDPATVVVDRIDSAAIHDAISALPHEFCTVCSLYLIEDMSYQEIAESLRIPVGTVRSRLHRGRAILRQELRSQAESRGIVQAVPAFHHA